MVVAISAVFLVSTYGWGRVLAICFYRKAPWLPAFHGKYSADHRMVETQRILKMAS